MPEYADLPNGTLHWKDYGGDGPPMVLVHGLGGSLANWDAIGPPLTARGRVVAVDLPGFGLSPPWKDWTLETHEAAVVEFIERLDGPVSLFGNSLGALVAELVAAHRGDLVEALVLISPATPPRLPDPEIDWRMARRLLINSTPVVGPVMTRRILNSMTPRELINDSLRRIVHKPGRVPIDMVESFVDIAEKRSHLPWAADAIPKTGQSIRNLFAKRSKFVSMIRDIKAPTMVMQGVADRIVSPNSVKWLCSLRPDWTLVHMEDTGHTPQIDAPVRTVSIIEPWLDAHRSTVG